MCSESKNLVNYLRHRVREHQTLQYQLGSYKGKNLSNQGHSPTPNR